MSDSASRDLPLTGERLLPDRQFGELVHAEHVVRYRLAARLAPGRRVLDAACGEGYGSAMLVAAGAQTVVGVDVDAETVAHARTRHGGEFAVADVNDLPFADGSFDLIVSFETIEHVPDPARMLDELRRVLAPGGLVIASTPNASEQRIDNPFHHRELATAEFVELLQARFGEVAILHQQNYLASAILDSHRFAAGDGEEELGLDAVKVAGAEPGRELYGVVVAGTELPRLEGNVCVLSGIHEAHELAERLTTAEGLVADWSERAAEAERLVEEWHARASEAERQVVEWHARALEGERQADHWSRHYAGVTGTLSWRITAPLRRMRRLTRRGAS